MRLCYKCHKNLKLEPANILNKKNSSENYLICNTCRDTDIVTKLLNTGNWEIIYNVPTLEDNKKFREEVTKK